MGQQLADYVNSLARCARMAVNHWFLLGWSGDGFFLPYLPGRSFATVSFHTVKSLWPFLNLAIPAILIMLITVIAIVTLIFKRNTTPLFFQPTSSYIKTTQHSLAAGN